MGMDGSPRDKMVNMMYLVLTALLAINMSKDILNAFDKINKELSVTTVNFAKKNASIYAAFEAAAAENPAKAQKWKDLAFEVKKKSDEIYDYIQDRKDTMVLAVDGLPPDFDFSLKYNHETGLPDEEHGVSYYRMIQKKDDANMVPLIMINRGGGEKLRGMITEYKEYLISIIDEKEVVLQDAILEILNTDDPPHDPDHPDTWVTMNFEHVPMITSLVYMGTMQSNVRNAEAEAIAYLQTKIDAGSFKFNKLSSTVIPSSSYVLEGSEYTAEVFLAAFDTTIPPTIFVGEYDPETMTMIGEEGEDYQKLETQNGKGVYNIVPNREGFYEWGGIIEFEGPDKAIRRYPFKREYQVARPSLTISPTKMNVLYIGVDNPISVSVPGVSLDAIQASISTGKLKSEGKGLYTATVGNGTNKAVINVKADVNGEAKNMGSMEFRVKRVPDPVAYMGGKKGSFTMGKSELLAQSAIIPVLENFDFDLNFNIISFEMSTLAGGFVVSESAKGNRITDPMRNIWQKLTKGSKIYLENIKAKGPDGSTRDLGSISVTLM